MFAIKMAQSSIDLGGRRLAFGDAGEGQPVICLHSGVPGATGEGDFAENLESLRARHRVVVVDLPSFGKSAAGAYRDDVAAAREAVRELLAHLGIGSASMIGNGFGGEVALQLAADSPQVVDRLVLIAPTGCRYSPFTPVPMEGTQAVTRYWQDPSTRSMAAVLALLNAGPCSNADADARHAGAVSDPARPSLSPPPSDLPDPLQLAPAVMAPTLLLWGREDRFSPVDYGLNLLARLPDARFHMLPRAGHNAQKDAAEEVNALLTDFLGDQA
jgi:pimeloyl-ACP methyl ester carboxylesterase